MKKASTTTNSAKRLKISKKAREAYAKRDPRLDRDPDAPQLPPDYWNNAVIGKYYRPLKTQISFRIDNEVPDWLKSMPHRLEGGGCGNGLQALFRPKAGRMFPAPSGLQEVDGLNRLL